jgi:hypothetical protein
MKGDVKGAVAPDREGTKVYEKSVITLSGTPERNGRKEDALSVKCK